MVSILDDFQWVEEYQETFRTLAEYFKVHPDQYQLALDSGARWALLSQLHEDDPQIETMARESAALIKSMPQVKELICNHSGMKKPLDSLYQEMVAGVLSPAQIKFNQLYEKFLLSED